MMDFIPFMKRLFERLPGPKDQIENDPGNENGSHSHLIRKLIGRIGLTLTPLRVYGFIRLGDIQYEARSKGNTFIAKDTPVRVVEIDRDTLVVIPLVGCPVFG